MFMVLNIIGVLTSLTLLYLGMIAKADNLVYLGFAIMVAVPICDALYCLFIMDYHDEIENLGGDHYG